MRKLTLRALLAKSYLKIRAYHNLFLFLLLFSSCFLRAAKHLRQHFVLPFFFLFSIFLFIFLPYQLLFAFISAFNLNGYLSNVFLHFLALVLVFEAKCPVLYDFRLEFILGFVSHLALFLFLFQFVLFGHF